MSDFQTRQLIKRTRKPHVCHYCGTEIATGLSAEKISGSFDGCIYAEYNHIDCREACDALNEELGTWGEDYVFLNQIDEHSDARFLNKKFPAVAKRLPICLRIADIDIISHEKDTAYDH